MPSFEFSSSNVTSLSLYFTHVTLPIPALCKESLYSDYNAGHLPRFLLYAMFSLSARFTLSSEILSLANGSRLLIGRYFATKARLELDQVTGDNHIASIAEVKAAYLLAYHDFTHLPSRTAADQCSKAVRAAYMCRLHQLDNEKAKVQVNTQAAELEKEEYRCLWWGIFSLDTFSSLISNVPPNIEQLSIATCLPITAITYATGMMSPTRKRVFLDDDLEAVWSSLQDNTSLEAKIQAVLIYVIALARDMIAIRRLCDENPRCNLDSGLVRIRQKWASLFSTLPSWFFSPSRHENEKAGKDHCKRLEVLNMINMLVPHLERFLIHPHSSYLREFPRLETR